MKIRKLIRRWLGIYVDFFPDEIAIRRMIAEELVKIMNNEYDGTYWHGGNMHNAFTRTIEGSLDRKLWSRVPEEVQRHVATEAFIDNIIERIKRKQI